MTQPLDGIRVLSIAPNVPGPVAAARLRDLGARVHKVEAPSGDLLETAAPEWYARLHDGIMTRIADFKTAGGRAALEEELGETDVFLTSLRLSALERLGYDWSSLQAKFPRIVHVAIVGEKPGDPETPGHDLTYLASAGLIEPFTLPRSLFADLAGAERAVSATLAALLLRARSGEGTRTIVSLAEVACELGEPVRAGLTGPGNMLGGGFAGYRIYATSDGFIALAALEPHFFKEVCDSLLVDGRFETLSAAFATQTCETWERYARERDIPLAKIPN